jgi:hypothetical protein
MDIASDIARLRQEGVSDDEILKGYRSYSPDDASDIDRLMGEGVSASDIVTGLTTYKRPAAAPEPGADDGVLTKTRKALQYGTAQGVTAVGSTVRNLGAGNNVVERAGKAFAPDQYDPAMPKFLNSGKDGFGWSHAPRALLEAAPAAVAGLGAAMYGWPAALGFGAAMNFGPTLDERKENNGGAALGAGDYAAAAGNSLISGVLDKVGAGGIAGATMKGAGLAGALSIPKAIASAGAKEGLTEAGQSVVDQAMKSVGTDKGLTIDPKQAIGEGILGAGVGAGLRTAAVPGDIANTIRYAWSDQDSNVRVADTLARLDNPITTSKDQKAALDQATAVIQSNISLAKPAAKGVTEQTGGAQIVENALAVLDKGGKLTKADVQELEAALGGHPDGITLLEGITDLNTINNLKARGTTSGDHFDGGLAGKTSRFLDPRRTASSLIGAAGLGIHNAGALAIPVGAQASMVGGLLASAIGAQTGAFAGVKGIDKIMGNSNPVGNFRDQFSGIEKKGRTIDAPVLSTDDLKALAAQATQKSKLDKTLTGAVKKGVDEAVKDNKKAWKLGEGIAQIEDNARKATDAEVKREAKHRDLEIESAWRQNAEEAPRSRAPQPLSDVAWRPVEPKLPKAASEEKLWAYQEKKQAAEVRLEKAKADNNQRAIAEADKALADIEQEYRTLELDIRALELKAEADAQKEATKEASRKATETDRGWKAYEAMQKAQKPSPALSDSLWAPQGKPVSDEVKARQVNDLFSAAEGPVNTRDVDADQAMSAIEREYAKRDAEAEKSIQQRIKEAEAAAKEAKKAEKKARAEQDDAEAKAQKKLAAQMNKLVEDLKKADASDQKNTDKAKAKAGGEMEKAFAQIDSQKRASIREEAEAVFKKPEGDREYAKPRQTEDDKPRIGVLRTFKHRGIKWDVPETARKPAEYEAGIVRNQDILHAGLSDIFGREYSNVTGEFLSDKSYEYVARARTASDAKSRLKQFLKAEGYSQLATQEVLMEFDAKLSQIYSDQGNE